jgi:hypothetical protein
VNLTKAKYDTPVTQGVQKATTTTSNQKHHRQQQRPVAYAFMYVNAAYTKRQYPKRLKQFFDFVGLDGDLEQQGQMFLEEARRQNDGTWATQQIVFYLDYHKQRVLNRKHKEGHITAGTLHTLYQPIKTFCDAYPDVSTKINWKRILRSLPRVKTFPNDIELILLGVPFVPKLLKYHSYNYNY